MSVVHNIYGVPVTTAIKGDGVRNVVCEEDAIIVEDDKSECPQVQDAYDIDKSVNVRCTQEACLFMCPAGHMLVKYIGKMKTKWEGPFFSEKI